MTIKAIEGKGQHRVETICDGCNRVEVIPCDYTRNPNKTWSPNEGQAKKKLAGMGWSDIKGKLRCPKCEAKRKVVPMQKPKEIEPQAVPEPTRRERLKIIATLMDVYDVDAGRYKEAETDNAVADVCEVRVGWVTQIREAEFGPDGGNDEIEKAMERLQAEIEALQAVLRDAESATKNCRVKIAEAQEFHAQIGRIKKAVGPRALQRANVSA